MTKELNSFIVKIFFKWKNKKIELLLQLTEMNFSHTGRIYILNQI